MITRLVPLFPFNLQNFAYGLTRIPFWTYVGMSWACMLPATVAFTLAGGALSGGGSPAGLSGSWPRAAVLIVLVSLAPAVARAPEPGRRGAPRTGPVSPLTVRLSIVIPVLDEARRLESLLPELLTTCPGAEVVVVDGGSADGSADVAARTRGRARASGAIGAARAR